MSHLVKRGVGGALNLGKKAVEKTIQHSQSKSFDASSPVNSHISLNDCSSQSSFRSTDGSDSSDNEDYVAEEGFDIKNLPSYIALTKGILKQVGRITNPEFRNVLKGLVNELNPVFEKAYQFYKSDPDLSSKWRFLPVGIALLFHDLTKPRRVNFVNRIVTEGDGIEANKDEVCRLTKHAMVVQGIYIISWEAKNEEDIAKYFQNEKQKLTDKGHNAMAEMSVVPESPNDIILFHLESQSNLPNWGSGLDKSRFIMFLDHKNKNLVICFRGTQSPIDALVDLDAKGAPFPSGEGFHQGFANNGIINGAKWFFDNALKTINEKLKKYSGYGIMITGHSLGGMMANIVTMELVVGSYGVCTKAIGECINSCDNSHLLPDISVRCAAFAPAPVFRRNRELSCSRQLDIEMKEKGIIEIAVHKQDIVPRLSIENLKIFVRLLDILDKHISSNKNMRRYLKQRIKKKSVADFPALLTVSPDELLRQLDQAILEFDRYDNPRVHPGQVFLVTPFKKEGEESCYRIYKVKDGKVISNNMEIVSKENVKDHLPTSYFKGIAQNIKRLSKKSSLQDCYSSGTKNKVQEQIRAIEKQFA